MHALVVTLKFDAINPQSEARIEATAAQMASVNGLLSSYWLRNVDRVVLVQSFESHRAINAYLDGETFAGLSHVPGARDVFVSQYDVSTRLNGLSVLGFLDKARDLVPA